MSRYKPRGYRLHAKRLSYVGTSSIRSIKYPIVSTSPELEESLSNAIIHDSEGLTGVYDIDAVTSGKVVYSIMDFWLDCLRIGVVFQPTNNQMYDFVKAYHKESSLYDEIFQSIPEALKNKLNKQKFISTILLTTGFRKGEKISESSLRKKITSVFDEKYLEDEDVQNIVSRFSKDVLTYNSIAQKQFLSELFGYKLVDSKKDIVDTTFYILPDLPYSPDAGIEQLIDRLSNITSADITIESLMGISDNGNALSKFLNEKLSMFRSGDLLGLKNSILALSRSWLSNESELIKRLEILVKKSGELSEPCLAKSWAEYRSGFVGKIRSWISNYRKYKTKTIEQLSAQKDELLLVRDKITQYDFELNMVDAMLKILDRGEFATDIKIYLDILSQLKVSLNKFFQDDLLFPEKKRELVPKDLKRSSSESSKVDLELYYKKNSYKVNVASVLKNLFSNVQRLPLFYGYAKKIKQEQVTSFYPRLTESLSLISHISSRFLVSNNPITEDYFLKQCNNIVRVYSTQNTNLFRSKYELLLKHLFGFIPDHKLHTAYASIYSKSDARKNVLSLLPDVKDYSSEIKFFLQTINIESIPWKNLNSKQLTDYVECLKLVLNWKLEISDKSIVYELPEPRFISSLKSYLDIFGRELNHHQVKYVLNSLILSEIRGIFSLISRTSFIVRSSVQLIGSETKFPIIIVPKSEKEVFDRYYVSFPQLPKMNNLSAKGNVYVIAQKEIFDFKQKDSGAVYNVFQICTSKYQTQFLDWFFNRHKSKYDVYLQRSEPMLINDTTYNASYNLTDGKISLKKVSNKIYYSQPFKLQSSEDKKTIHDEGVYLGLDIGEYGVAYAVLDTSHNFKILDRGFIYSKSLRKIRDHIEKIKMRQVPGTFNFPITSLQRIREDTVGAIRNSIHAVALHYNAKPIYEFEISAFETAGNRVAKIYHSIKKSDVKGRNSADDSVAYLVWGTKKAFGSQVGAYGTSQTCSKCHRSILKDVSDDFKYEVKRYEDFQDIYFAESSNLAAPVLFFSRTSPTSLNGKDLKKYAYKFMRPPLDSDFLKKKFPTMDFTSIAYRGNSSVFVCPYVDCLHLSDADIQAAFNIALKGYIKDLAKQQGNQEKYFIDFFDFVKTGELPTIYLF